MAFISEFPYINYGTSYIDTDNIRKEMEKILNSQFGKLTVTKGSKEMENETRSIESVFRTLIDSHTYIYFKGSNIDVKNDLYSTLEFIKRTLKSNGFEKKEIVIVKKSLELIETVLTTYDKELNMSKPEIKSFNNIICDIKQSLSERERI